MKPTVHLAYTAPFGPTLVRRGIDKALRLAHLPPLYRSGQDFLIPWQHPIRAPHSITYQLLHAIRDRGYPVRLYSLYEHGVAPMKKGDIFIGQPLPSKGMGQRRSLDDDPLSVTSRTLREFPSPRNFILMPYAHDTEYSTFAKKLIAENNATGGGAIFIGGDIWQRDWETKSPYADLGHLRKTHITAMGIDPAEYPLVKKSFNQKGKRRYLYIGHTAWYKNTAELERIAERMPQFEFGHIGGGSVRGWKKIADFATLTPAYMARLAKEYDIFVTVSTADPQATTIVEQMCFGLAVACTSETGYEYDTVTRLFTADTDANVRILTALQDLEEDELISLARQNREIVEKKHSWQQFVSCVLDFAGVA